MKQLQSKRAESEALQYFHNSDPSKNFLSQFHTNVINEKDQFNAE